MFHLLLRLELQPMDYLLYNLNLTLVLIQIQKFLARDRFYLQGREVEVAKREKEETDRETKIKNVSKSRVCMYVCMHCIEMCAYVKKQCVLSRTVPPYQNRIS